MEQALRQLKRRYVCYLFSLSSRGIADAPGTSARIPTENINLILKFMPRVVMQVCNSSTREAEGG